MTSEKVSGMSKTAERVILKGDGSFDTLVSRLWEKLKVFWTHKKSGYLMEPIRVKDDLRKVIRDV